MEAYVKRVELSSVIAARKLVLFAGSNTTDYLATIVCQAIIALCPGDQLYPIEMYTDIVSGGEEGDFFILAQ